MELKERDAMNHAKERAEELLSRMSLEEKVGQMCNYAGDGGSEDPALDDLKGEQAASDLEAYKERMKPVADLVKAGRIGSFVKVPDFRAANWLQECARASRLGIPLLMGTDAIHGHALYTREATVFPTPISMASAFDPSLVRRSAAATAREMRATGFHWDFAPNVDVVRDQRWGRTGETFGEDPFLAASCGAAMTEGLQGDLTEENVMACAKHFVGSGEAFNGINGSEIDVSDRTLEAVHFPPFRRNVEAGVLSVMAAHHAVNGVPCHCHGKYIKGLLRGTWGFEGIVVSDWMDVGRLHTSQRVADSFRHACELAVNAGIDVHVAGDGFFESVLDSAAAGRIPAETIDGAALRILTAKFRLGLFEEPAATGKREAFTLRSPDHRILALEGALESLVLLRNEGALLPLREAGRRILVTGPLADSRLMLGDWVTTVQQRGVETVLEALRRLAPGDGAVEYAACGSPRAASDAEIGEACRRAAEADVVVACVGENSFRWSAEPKTSGENCDRADLGLPGRQEELVERLAAAGRPVVMVLFSSRANSLARLAERVPAILMAWEPGMYAGEAVAGVLLGRRSPSGRLPVSMPRSSGHLRCLYDRPPLRLSRYGDGEETPLFPFGHGLGYAPVRLENVEHPAAVCAGEALPLEVDVVNGGAMETDHVVLAFLRDVVGSVTTPERRLCAFQRVERLLPGERRRVRLSVEPQRMALVDAEGRWRIEPGRFELRLEGLTTSFDVVQGAALTGAPPVGRLGAT